MSRSDPLVLAVGRCFDREADYRAAKHALSREGISLFRADDQHNASLWICEADPAVVLIDLSLTEGSPLAVADFCNYRRPDTRVILRGTGKLMAHGSLFGHVGNAAAMISAQMPGEDLVSLLAFQVDKRLAVAMA